MGKPFHILLLGAAKRVSIAEKLMACGNSRGLDTRLFSYELDPYVPIASVAQVLVGLKWNDPAILEDLERMLEKHAIGMVLPFVDPAIGVASRLAVLHPKVFIPIPGPETCELMFDKIAADAWFRSQGFPVPPGTGKFPLIAKPRFGSASKGLIMIPDAPHLEEWLRSGRAGDYLVQQWIQAEEYTVDGYVDPGGRIIALVPRKRLEVQGGEATKSITQREPQILQLCDRILASSLLRGPVTLQFLKETDSGRVLLMEINPRLGGGVLTSIAAGADIAAYLVNDFQGIPNTRQDHWKEHVIMTRAFREFYFYADNH